MPSIFNNEQNCSYPPEPIAEYYVTCDSDGNVIYSPAPTASVIYHDFTPKELIKRGIDPSRISFPSEPRSRVDASDVLSSYANFTSSSDSKPE